MDSAEMTSNRIDVFLDDDPTPLASYSPPLRFELDTTLLSDGRHTLRIEAYDSNGTKGVKTMTFTVRNGPGIAVSGIRENDVLEGNVPVLVNSFGGAVESKWEPSRAETPSPAPTWAWVLVIMLVAYGLYYGVQHWNPPPDVLAATGTVEAGAVAPAASDEDGADLGGASTEATSQSSAVSFDAELGATVYSANCSSCHQPTGLGLPGVFPPIAGDPVVTADDPTEHIQIVLGGLQGKEIGGVAYVSPMPAFGGLLTDEQIAAVLNYQRTNFGNDAPLVTLEEVASQR